MRRITDNGMDIMTDDHGIGVELCFAFNSASEFT